MSSVLQHIKKGLNLKDEYKINGHIIIESIDFNGNIIDRYENHNLIMDGARKLLAKNIAGTSAAVPMNKFVLGTEGHIEGDYSLAKTEAEGFVSSRTKLFSEETIHFNYPITFTNPAGVSGNCTINSAPNPGNTISRVMTDSNITYTIVIPTTAGNNAGLVVYSEAALYAGTNLFSMKCFPGKIKDNTVSLRVIWTIKM